jgi:hypothetical protein
MGSFLSWLVCHLYRMWGYLYYDVVDIQATFDEVESGDRSEDQIRTTRWSNISALISMRAV